jgi:hypothetical protein
MIRTMSTARLYVAGRVTAFLTIVFIVVALVIGALAVSKMHPPRVTGHGPKTSARPSAGRSDHRPVQLDGVVDLRVLSQQLVVERSRIG